MVDAQPGIAGPAVPEVMPVGVDAADGIASSDRVRPALCKQALVRFPALWLKHRVVSPRPRVINVLIGRQDVEIVCEDHRQPCVEKTLRMFDQSLEPSK